MGKPVTLLESLCAHAISFHARVLVVEPKDGSEWVYIKKRTGNAIRVANWNKSSSEAKELLENLSAAVKKPFRAILDGDVCVVQVRVFESLGEEAFEATIDPAPKLDPAAPPKFTAKQASIWRTSTTTSTATAKLRPRLTWNASSWSRHPRSTP